MPVVEHMIRLLKAADAYIPLGWDDNSYEITKFCVVADGESRREEFFATLKDEFEVYMQQNSSCQGKHFDYMNGSALKGVF